MLGVFGATHTQQKQFKEMVFKAMVTSCIPFDFVENSYIKKAFGVFGVSPLTRKQISGRMLDDLEADTQAATATDVRSGRIMCASVRSSISYRERNRMIVALINCERADALLWDLRNCSKI